MQGAGFRQDLCIQAPIYTLNIRHTPEFYGFLLRDCFY